MFKKTAYSRLFAIFMVCLLILECALFSLIAWSRDSVQNELNRSTANSLTYLSDQLDADISHLQYQMQCITQSQYILHLFTYYETMKPSELYTEIEDALNYLDSICLYNRNISKLEVYNYKYNLRLGAGDTPNVVSLNGDEMQNLLSEARSSGFHLLSSLDGELTVNYLVPISAYKSSDKAPTFYLRATFLRTKMLEKLNSLSSDEDAAMAYLIYQPENVVYATGTAPDCAATLTGLAFTEEVSFFDVTMNNRQYVAVGKLLDKNPDCLLVQLIDAQKLYAFPNRLLKLTILFTLCGFGALAFYMFGVHRTVKRPINDLLHAFDSVSEGKMQVRLDSVYTDEFNRLSRHFNRMSDKLEGLIEKEYKQTILLQDAKMKHLQAQINPHFLYNSFYLLSHLVKMEDQETAEKLSRYLGDYFGYITDQSKDVLPLQEEYGHAITYLNIQKMRFENRVCDEIEPLPQEAASLVVPRLILQPLLENALEHGIGTAKQLLIRLSFHFDEPYLQIFIEDSGSTLTDETISRLNTICQSKETPINHALNNIHSRLIIYYGDPACGLFFSRSALGGLQVCMTIKREEGA